MRSSSLQHEGPASGTSTGREEEEKLAANRQKRPPFFCNACLFRSSSVSFSLVASVCLSVCLSAPRTSPEAQPQQGESRAGWLGWGTAWSEWASSSGMGGVRQRLHLSVCLWCLFWRLSMRVVLLSSRLSSSSSSSFFFFFFLRRFFSFLFACFFCLEKSKVGVGHVESPDMTLTR